MRKHAIALRVSAAAAVLALASGVWAADKMASDKMAAAKPAEAAKGAKAGKAAGGGDAAVIASASRAAPASVAGKATIMKMSAGGQMQTVRKGSNGWTCIPDSPDTPGPDPMCFDESAAEWVAAWSGHKPPPAKTGLMYMLEGGTDASNVDPYATKPTAKNHWIKTGPHIMIVGDPEMLKAYPASPDPNTAAPYVMWSGTPYAHLMVPVK